MKNSGTGIKRILVVEDEPAICEVCRRVLTGEGFEVDIAVNGKVAQDMLGERDYDLCLIDIRTPVMNGKQLYQYIKEKYPRLVSRLIFTTGDLIDRDTESFLELAGRPFLPKPFTPGELKNHSQRNFEADRKMTGKQRRILISDDEVGARILAMAAASLKIPVVDMAKEA